VAHNLGNVREVCPCGSSETEVPETGESFRREALPLENGPVEVLMSILVFQVIDNFHLSLELLTCLMKPLEVFSFDFKGECLVLLDCSVSNLVHLE